MVDGSQGQTTNLHPKRNYQQGLRGLRARLEIALELEAREAFEQLFVETPREDRSRRPAFQRDGMGAHELM